MLKLGVRKSWIKLRSYWPAPVTQWKNTFQTKVKGLSLARDDGTWSQTMLERSMKLFVSGSRRMVKHNAIIPK
jgi:hypothetical protein